MKTYRIATIPGDGIGKEVVPAGQQVMEALGGLSFAFESFAWGGDYYRRHGMMMPENGLWSVVRPAAPFVIADALCAGPMAMDAG